MAITQLFPALYRIQMGVVNVYLIDDPEDGLVLLDTGYPGSAASIFRAVGEIGKNTAAVRHLLVTHCHADHAGSLAAIKRETGALAYMHPLDAAMVRAGKAYRPTRPAPDLVNQLLYRLFIRNAPREIEPAEIDFEVAEDDVLPFAGGIRVVHIPGHSAGQVAYLWDRYGGVIFAADAASNFLRLGLMISYEDLEVGRKSLRKLAGLAYEAACLGHGAPILEGAALRFRKKWG